MRSGVVVRRRDESRWKLCGIQCGSGFSTDPDPHTSARQIIADACWLMIRTDLSADRDFTVRIGISAHLRRGAGLNPKP